MHQWNTILVKRYTHPMPNPSEFSVQAETLQSAYSKILEKFKTEYEDKKWKIQSIYWLDPNNYRKEED